MAEESQYLSFMGLRVHFTVCEPETPVKHRTMLLCSPLMTTFHWRKLLPELSESGCLSVMVDLPGFGLSDCGAPQNNLMRASILWGILDEVDAATDAPMSTWHLIGHGSACSAILSMTSLYPDSVRSQVHLTPQFSLQGAEWDKLRAKRWFADTVTAAGEFRKYVERLSGYPMDDYVLDRMRRPLLREGAAESFAEMLNTKPEKVEPTFCPAMIIMGGKDPLMTDTTRKEIAEYLPEAETHLLRSAGHFPTETHSKALRDYLRGWLKYNE